MREQRAVVTRRRAWIALVCGLAAGGFAFVTAVNRAYPRDFAQVWYASRVLLSGGNPYDAIGPGRAFPWPWPFYYPLPAAVATLPLAPLSSPLASALFMAAGVGLFAWAITENGMEPAVGLGSASVLFAVEAVQWSPLLVASVVVAPVGVFLICKPNIGAALFLARPNWWALLGGLALLALSFALVPHWLTSWHAAATVPNGFKAPLLFPGGIFVLLALSRWRRPEARLLVALACVPQTTLLYETVPLFLVPRTIRESALLTLVSYGVAYYTARYGAAQNYAQWVSISGRAITLAMYLPTTAMVLVRSNEGAIPDWLELRLAGLPSWLRGRPPVHA